jgi:hypothetical protein
VARFAREELIAKAWEEPPRRSQRKMTDEELAEGLRHVYCEQGYTLRELELWSGVSRETIRLLFRRMGIPRRRQGRRREHSYSGFLTPLQAERVRGESARWSQSEVARRWQLSRQAVHKIVHGRSHSGLRGRAESRATEAPEF